MSGADLLLSSLGLIGTVTIAWLTWRVPVWAVSMLVSSVPLQAYARIEAGASGITWTQAWLWTFLAVGVALYGLGLRTISIDAVTLAFAAVVVCYSISIRAVTDRDLWSAELYRWGVMLALLIVARALITGPISRWPLLLATAVGAIWTTVVAIVQVVGDVGPSSFERGGMRRAYASFGEPNTFGAFAGLSLVISAAYLLFGPMRSTPRTAAFVGIGALSAAIGLALSQSRGALAAAGLTLVAMVLIVAARRTPPLALRGAAAAALVVLALIIAPRIASGLIGTGRSVEVTTASWADAERLAHWGAAINMVVDSGGTGIGAGQFDVRYRDVTPTWRFRISQGHAHNAYLQVAAEAGIVGLAAYLALLVAVLVALVERLRRGRPDIAVVVAIALTSAFALHNLVDYLHVLNLPIILIAWWALALGRSEGSATTS